VLKIVFFCIILLIRESEKLYFPQSKLFAGLRGPVVLKTYPAIWRMLGESFWEDFSPGLSTHREDSG
jgi:hypothetical protein